LLSQDEIDVNLQDNNGFTALHSAVDHYEITRFLLLHAEINVNLQTAEGDTALMMALRIGKQKVAGALLDRDDLKLDLKNVNEQTAFTIADSKNLYKEEISSKLQASSAITAYLDYDIVSESRNLALAQVQEVASVSVLAQATELNTGIGLVGDAANPE
jgi:ankyrin repeat protein